jgi:3-phenylpropionate/cinnamic acid dioxygenase small subunit
MEKLIKVNALLFVSQWN